MTKYRFTSAALSELREATLYYEQKENGLGASLLDDPGRWPRLFLLSLWERLGEGAKLSATMKQTTISPRFAAYCFTP